GRLRGGRLPRRPLSRRHDPGALVFLRVAQERGESADRLLLERLQAAAERLEVRGGLAALVGLEQHPELTQKALHVADVHGFTPAGTLTWLSNWLTNPPNTPPSSW